MRGKDRPSESPPRGRRRGALRALAALVLAIALSTLCPSLARAATLHRTGFSGVPADTVRIDYPLSISDADFSTTNPGFAVSWIDDIWGVPANTVVYDRAAEPGSIPGSFTLFWENAGTDEDGSAIDLTLTFSDIYTQSSVPDLILLDDGTGLCLDASTITEHNAGVSMSVTAKVTKHGSAAPAAGNL